MIRVLVVDDHDLMREGLKAILARAKDIQVIGEAGDGLDAVEMALEKDPDIVLMDLAMPGVDGLKATEQIAALSDRIKVLVISGHSDRQVLRQALKSGAKGYVVKSAEPDELIQAIRSLERGEMYFSPEVFSFLSEELIRP